MAKLTKRANRYGLTDRLALIIEGFTLKKKLRKTRPRTLIKLKDKSMV